MEQRGRIIHKTSLLETQINFDIYNSLTTHAADNPAYRVWKLKTKHIMRQ